MASGGPGTRGRPAREDTDQAAPLRAGKPPLHPAQEHGSRVPALQVPLGRLTLLCPVAQAKSSQTLSCQHCGAGPSCTPGPRRETETRRRSASGQRVVHGTAALIARPLPTFQTCKRPRPTPAVHQGVPPSPFAQTRCTRAFEKQPASSRETAYRATRNPQGLRPSCSWRHPQ